MWKYFTLSSFSAAHAGGLILAVVQFTDHQFVIAEVFVQATLLMASGCLLLHEYLRDTTPPLPTTTYLPPTPPKSMVFEYMVFVGLVEFLLGIVGTLVVPDFRSLGLFNFAVWVYHWLMWRFWWS